MKKNNKKTTGLPKFDNPPPPPPPINDLTRETVKYGEERVMEYLKERLKERGYNFHNYDDFIFFFTKHIERTRHFINRNNYITIYTMGSKNALIGGYIETEECEYDRKGQTTTIYKKIKFI